MSETDRLPASEGAGGRVERGLDMKRIWVALALLMVAAGTPRHLDRIKAAERPAELAQAPDAIPESVKQYARRIQLVLLSEEMELDGLRRELPDMQKAKVSPKASADGTRTTRTDSDGVEFSYQTGRAKRAAIEKAKARIQDLEPRVKRMQTGDPPSAAPLVPHNLAIGACGSFSFTQPNEAKPRYWLATVLQVLNKEAALVYTTNYSYNGNASDTAMWLHGISTIGVIDGQELELKLVYFVTGTKTYKTDSGSNTVFMVTPIDIPRYRQQILAIVNDPNP